MHETRWTSDLIQCAVCPSEKEDVTLPRQGEWSNANLTLDYQCNPTLVQKTITNSHGYL